MSNIPIRRFSSLNSTNVYCMTQAAELDHGTLVVADTQTGGRGRCGRTWHSPAGMNLYCSLILKAPFLGRDISIYPQIAALAAYDTIGCAGVSDAWVKWPNDICVGLAKLAGILCESKLAGAEPSCVVIGFGINVNMPWAEVEQIARPATSILLQTGREYDRDLLAEQLYAHFDRHYVAALSGGYDYIRPLMQEADGLLGSKVVLTAPNDSFTGIVDGLERDGGLRLALESGEIRVFHAGEVSLRPITEDFQ